jgi:hypothetical protein
MTRRCMLSAGVILLAIGSAAAQKAPTPSPSADPTFRSSSHLVLVPVVALKNGLPEKTLKQDDFQVFDNGHPVSINSYDSAAQFSTRPLAVWFVLQCNMQGWEKEGSGLFAGQIHLFEPALKDLDKQDSVAVAHWCDDGQSNLDLLPTKDVNQVVNSMEQVLTPMPYPEHHGRTGELALQKTLQLIIDTTHSMVPEPVPILIFLYGDYSGMPKSEANHFINELLETSAIAFGLRDRRSPNIGRLWGEQRAVANYIATETGGEYLWVTPDTYATGLQEILQQLHFRYELGFKPATLDGKRHKLRVDLTETAKAQHAGVRLRFRLAYVPAPPPAGESK